MFVSERKDLRLVFKVYEIFILIMQQLKQLKGHTQRISVGFIVRAKNKKKSHFAANTLKEATEMLCDLIFP